MEEQKSRVDGFELDPTRTKQFWNVLLQRAASDCAEAIELYVRGQNPHCKKQTTADPSEVANLFRDEYAKIGTDSLPPGHSFDIAARARQDAALAAILDLPEHEGPCGASINVREIQEAINKLKYGKASGVDCISTDLLKICAGNRHMLVSLAVIFSQCLRESRNPADWQIALVKTLFKKGDRHSWKNYRLISLLSVVGKLYESVLANRLSSLLDGCDRRGEHLLSQFQGGFRRGRSCQHQSWVLSELIKSNARRGKKTYVAFLDVREAYPTCRRAAMLERLYVKLAAAPRSLKTRT